MPLSTEKIDSIKNLISQKENPIDDIQQNVSSAIKDPFGQIINKTFFKINGLVSNIEKKIDQLLQEVAKSTDSKGRVTLEGSTIVVTITKEDVDQAKEIKRRVEEKINSVQKTISTLETTLKSLQTVQTAMTTLQTALSIQEAVLSLNPTTGPIFSVFKKSIKLIFLKDIIKEYTNVIKLQLNENLKVLDRLSTKFRNITIDVKILDEKNKGNDISTAEAERILTQDLLNQGAKTKSTDIETISESFTSPSNKKYILKVEKYGQDKLIGRAYEEISGMIEEQTAPSYFLEPQALIEELKSILNFR
jgi:hypothetical protein